MRRYASFVLILLAGLVLLFACEPTNLEYKLTVQVVGEGTITPRVGNFDKGTIITFNIQPVRGWTFDRWEGEDQESLRRDGTEWCLLMDNDKQLTAVFKRLQYDLNITVEEGGQVEQELISREQAADYEYEDVVQLRAVADEGWLFKKWLGDATGINPVITIRMDEDKAITAVFERRQFDLNIDIVGRGQIKQELLVNNTSAYPYETFFKLTALPDAGYEFVRWLGDVNGTEPVIEINIDGIKKLTAVFTGPALSGFVTDTRGGPGLENVKIYSEEFEIYTDEDGYFFLEETNTQNKFDLLVEKEGYAGALVQDIYTEENNLVELEIPLRKPFHPGWPLTPPRIQVEGVEKGDVVSGDLDLRVSIDGNVDAYVFYVYFCGLQRFPVEFQEVRVNEGEGKIDTTLFPNGKGFVRILAYDKNENLAMTIIPITIDNGYGDHEQPPENLATLNVTAVTHGGTYGFFSKGTDKIPSHLNPAIDPFTVDLWDGRKLDLRDIPTGCTAFSRVDWDPVEGADGYEVYRSFDGTNFNWIGDLPKTKITTDMFGASYYLFEDFCPLLRPGQTTYYKVIPYNNVGLGNGLVRSATHLPPFEVLLLEPDHHTHDVSLLPTFIWEPTTDFDDDTELRYIFTLFDGTAGNIVQAIILEADPGRMEFPLEEMMLPGFGLQPKSVYSWDIYASSAHKWCEYTSNGASAAQSITGAMGAINGEFIFTTKDDGEQN